MVRFVKEQFSRIKNPHRKQLAKDFDFSIFAFINMLFIFGIFAGLWFILSGGDTEGIGLLSRGVIAVAIAALIYVVLPQWAAIIPAIIIAQIALFAPYEGLLPVTMHDYMSYSMNSFSLIPLAGVFLAIISGPSIQVVYQWDKVVVLRLGKFKKVHDPGLFYLVPLIDRCAAFVDTRIRVTDFSAEKILTRDTVPVHVDALAFWMIWDAQKATLEVENFLEAVTLSAQTALRDSVGKYTLTTLLSERETLYKEIQTILDQKTNPWGISILSVEFTDIVLPAELEEVMSRQAQAEREKSARMFLAEAERDIAGEFSKAADVYKNNPEALNLRAMNMVYDGMKSRGSLILLPSAALDNMNLGSVMGMSGLAKKGNINDIAAELNISRETQETGNTVTEDETESDGNK